MAYIEREELYILQNGLKNFILKEKSRYMRLGENNQNLMKYRGLKFSINAENPREILFVVRIATLEASFRIRDGIKVLGSLGGDERFVYQWFIFNCDKSLMKKAATCSLKTQKSSVNEHSSNQERYFQKTKRLKPFVAKNPYSYIIILL